MRKAFKPFLLILFLIILLCSAASAEILDAGKWDPGTRAQIQKMIDANGAGSPGYSAAKKPYAVFDWDQTCIFNDTEESLFRYMIDNVAFKATPSQFALAIRNGVPGDDFSKSFNNRDGKPVNIDRIASDLDADYRYLYRNYILTKRMMLEEIKATEEFIDFRGKLAYLYEAIGGTFSADVSYPWVLYLFVGMSEAEVRAVSEIANDAALHDSLDTYAITSSLERPGKAGVVSLSGYKRGLRLAPEMSNLMNVLRASGIDVYICSASHETVVRVFAGLPKYGYNVPPENVIGMKTKMENGVYLGEYDYSGGYPQTQQKGKTQAIQQMLASRYGYGPVFVAGDSQGDFNMSTDFSDTQLTLVINRLRSDDFGKLGRLAVNERGADRARYVMQGRDENTGQFRPSASTIKMGASEEALLHPSLQQ
jgi:phosphoglycolate phosphatase-like HAD superfamily hydrolase